MRSHIDILWRIGGRVLLALAGAFLLAENTHATAVVGFDEPDPVEQRDV